MKLVSTSSLIFFSLEKMSILMSGSDSLAFWKLSLCSLMKSLMVSSTSVSALEPSSMRVDSMTLLMRLLSSFISNMFISFSSINFICFFMSFTSLTSCSSVSSSSAWSM